MTTLPEFNEFMDTELGLCKKGIELCDIECVELLMYYIRDGADKSNDTAALANEKFRLLSQIIQDKSGLKETFPEVKFFTGMVQKCDAGGYHKPRKLTAEASKPRKDKKKDDDCILL